MDEPGTHYAEWGNPGIERQYWWHGVTYIGNLKRKKSQHHSNRNWVIANGWGVGEMGDVGKG